jgi:hypothetical protein
MQQTKTIQVELEYQLNRISEQMQGAQLDRQQEIFLGTLN